jgi:Ca-activated chloride channel family protein
MALVLFAGEAVRHVPLTKDLPSLAELARLASPLSVAKGGTDLGAAIERAVAALEGAGVVVVVTDGGDHGGGGRDAAAAAAASGVVVHTVGLGSERGAKIPVDGAFLTDRDGRDVVTAMDADSLAAVADAGGGTFVAATDHDRALVALYASHIGPMAEMSHRAEKSRERPNRYQWVLLPGLFLWTLSLCVREQRN